MTVDAFAKGAVQIHDLFGDEDYDRCGREAHKTHTPRFWYFDNRKLFAINFLHLRT